MRVSTTIFLAFAEQSDNQESATGIAEDLHRAGQPAFELVSLFEGTNRVIVIEQGED